MIRRLYTVVTAVSLLLFVAAVLAWWRSKSATEVWMYTACDEGSVLLTSREDGRLEVTAFRGWPDHGWRRWNVGTTPPAQRLPSWEVAGPHKLWRTDREYRWGGCRLRHGPLDVLWQGPGGPPVDEDVHSRMAALLEPWICRLRSDGPPVCYYFSVTGWEVQVPHRHVAGLSAFLPLVWACTLGRDALRRHRRATRGLCTHCGYDLRASSGRCPECGRPVPASPARASTAL